MSDTRLNQTCHGSPTCSLRLAQTQEQRQTQVASHEFAEMITNLLSNALRHTPPGGSVVVRVAAASSGAMSAGVRDTGSGMTPEAIARAFDRFYKGSGSRGSGLGLTIARSLVAAHGGEIHASSEPGRGTTIAFTLPTSDGARRLQPSGGNHGHHLAGRSLFGPHADQAPAFTIAAIVSLALGIGANTTIFTLLNTLFLNPLPVARPSELVAVLTVASRNATQFGNLLPLSYPNLKDFRERNSVLTDITGYSPPLALSLTTAQEPQRVFAQLVPGTTSMCSECAQPPDGSSRLTKIARQARTLSR